MSSELESDGAIVVTFEIVESTVLVTMRPRPSRHAARGDAQRAAIWSEEAAAWHDEPVDDQGRATLTRRARTLRQLEGPVTPGSKVAEGPTAIDSSHAASKWAC